MTGRIAISVSEYTAAAARAAHEAVTQAGREAALFQADGEGGRALEDALRAGEFAGVLDLALTEIADQEFEGVGSAGTRRMEAAAQAGVPAVVAPGGLDIVRFGRQESVPLRFARRRLYVLDPEHTLMRVDNDQAARLGRLLAEKLNASTGPVRVFLPLRGLSALSAPDGPLRDATADTTFFGNFSTHVRRDIPLFEALHSLNAPEFARAAAESLLMLLEG